MYTCMKLTLKNIEQFKEINQKRACFNPLSEDFFRVYDAANFPQQLLLRKKVRLLEKENQIYGFIWVTPFTKYVQTINAMYVEESDHILTNYDLLIDSLKQDCIYTYLCEKNDKNFNILQSLGFSKKEGTLEMSLSLDDLHLLSEKIVTSDIEFEHFQKGIHEELRCLIQNEAFKNHNRMPLSVEDIYYDEMQNYFYEDGAVFIKRDSQYIGYGQIILHENRPTIVNLGLLSEYKGNGYGKSLLYYLLRFLKEQQYSKVYLKVNPDNKPALLLYEKAGFKTYNEYYEWELKR